MVKLSAYKYIYLCLTTFSSGLGLEGDLEEKSLPVLADLSLFWAEEEIKMYRR